ncbi:MAG TPA: hypothetical protein VFE27_22305 [Acidobacteriaceae bacterium]|jgi:hypothetical protein|nr:hypothetical protein [Acidobacteriaceae bacterium]
MTHTPEILNIACPACHAAPTARCYDKVRDGSKHRDVPHQERVAMAEGRVHNCTPYDRQGCPACERKMD